MLSRQQKDTLRNAGFLWKEVRAFSMAKTPDKVTSQEFDLTTATWQKVIDTRKQYVAKRMDEGWSKPQIRRALIRYYRRGKKSPWDYIQAVGSLKGYRPMVLVKDFVSALERRRLSKSKIGKVLGKSYTRARARR